MQCTCNGTVEVEVGVEVKMEALAFELQKFVWRHGARTRVLP